MTNMNIQYQDLLSAKSITIVWI